MLVSTLPKKSWMLHRKRLIISFIQRNLTRKISMPRRKLLPISWMLRRRILIISCIRRNMTMIISRMPKRQSAQLTKICVLKDKVSKTSLKRYTLNKVLCQTLFIWYICICNIVQNLPASLDNCKKNRPIRDQNTRRF